MPRLGYAKLLIKDIKVERSPEFSCKKQSSTLVNLSGLEIEIKSGESVAMIGPSGAGKSTLIRVLAGFDRDYTGRVERYVDGDFDQSGSAFIHQDDVFYDFLTVYEHLKYQAALRFGKGVSESERLKYVDDIISMVGLEKAKNVLIGGPKSLAKNHISGGESRRLSIATELLRDPKFIFADEPTSGLDASNASKICDILKKVTDDGGIVIAVIHQPNAQIFNTFSNVALMANTRMVFYGPIKCAFAWICHTCPSPLEDSNIAEVLIDSISQKGLDLEEYKGYIDNMADRFRLEGPDFVAKWKVETSIPSSIKELSSHDPVLPHFQKKLKGASNPFMLKIIIIRMFAYLRRNPLITFARVGQTLTMGMVPGLIYLRIGFSAKDVNNRVALSFLLFINLGVMVALNASATFSADLKVVERESASGVIHPWIFATSRMIFDLIPAIFSPIVLNGIIFLACGIAKGFKKYALTSLLLILFNFSFMSHAYIIVTLISNPSKSLSIIQLFQTILSLLSGVLMVAKNMPIVVQFISYISPYKFGLNSYVSTILAGQMYYEEAPFEGSFAGDDALTFLGLDKTKLIRDIVVMAIMSIIGRIIAIIIIEFKVRRHTPKFEYTIVNGESLEMNSIN